MANPQKENGYTAIANELFDALIANTFSGEDRKVLDFVLRKTYGFNKKEDRISLTQFESATKMCRKNICRSIGHLVKRNVIRKKVSKIGNSYSLVKDFERWGVVAKLPRGKSDTKGSGKFDTRVVANLPHTKDIVKYKDTKDITSSSAHAAEGKTSNFDPKGAEVIRAFCDFNPACSKYYGNTTQRGACDRLIKSYGLEKVLKVVAILPRTNVLRYVPTITTPYALEEKWSALESAMLKRKAEQEDKLTKYKVAFN